MSRFRENARDLVFFERGRDNSSHLGRCWHLEESVEDSQAEVKDYEKARKKKEGRSRRQKFRDQGGPSREELQTARIASILQEIPVLESTAPYFAQKMDPIRCQTNGDYNRACHSNGGVSVPESLGTNDASEGMESYLWPLARVSELGSDLLFPIDWEAMSAIADPMRGLGYKPPAGCCNVNRPEKHSQRSLRGGKRGHDEDDDGEGEGGLARGERKRSQVASIATALKSFNLPAALRVDISPHMSVTNTSLDSRIQGEMIASGYYPAALKSFNLPTGSVVVDFGCGSGALSLPLACLFQDLTFVCVDYKHESIRLLDQRTQAANLTNVSTWQGRIEDYMEPFDACVALHACGNATDLSLVQALRWRAGYVVSPCCVGKLQFAVITPTTHSSRRQYTPGITSAKTTSLEGMHPHGGLLNSATSNNQKPVDSSINDIVISRPFIEDQIQTPPNDFVSPNVECGRLPKFVKRPLEIRLTYPRSLWLQSVVSPSDFVLLARTADWSSYDRGSQTSRLHSLCKVVVELDRNQASRELGYQTCLLSLADQNAGAVGVGHVLVGKPMDQNEYIFC